jgi:hypothetical protein
MTILASKFTIKPEFSKIGCLKLRNFALPSQRSTQTNKFYSNVDKSPSISKTKKKFWSWYLGLSMVHFLLNHNQLLFKAQKVHRLVQFFHETFLIPTTEESSIENIKKNRCHWALTANTPMDNERRLLRIVCWKSLF